MRGATLSASRLLAPVAISIHAPHAGCDILNPDHADIRVDISIHAPHAGCDDSPSASASVPVAFQSTHPMRGATLCEEDRPQPEADFNPRTPCGVRRTDNTGRTRKCHFNPRTPCGVRRDALKAYLAEAQISIHAPHAGCDSSLSLSIMATPSFQSTHPMRGVTKDALEFLALFKYFNPRTPCGVRLLPWRR